jgi:hypothetical protein
MKAILSIIIITLAGLVHANPNHLLPVPAYDSDGYSQAVFESLIGNLRPEIWMVVRPSFEEEYAIILYRDIEYEEASGVITYPRKMIRDDWRLSKVMAKKKIWAWKEIGGGQSELDIKPTKDVAKHSIIVNKKDYEKVVLAWKSALKTTRYPINKNLGLDGTTYQFYAHYQLFGQTWSPKEGLPLMLVNLGSTLEEIIKAKENDRRAVWVKANGIANEIINQQP